MSQPVVLIAPGLYNSGPMHWQTHWENEYGFTRIQQKDWDTPDCDDWVNTIDQAVLNYPLKNVILVGHSSACAAIAFWYNKYRRVIKGALLVGPSDSEGPNYPKGPTGFQPMPISRIGFPTIVVTSDDDMYVTLERAQYFAECWGSQLTLLCKAGHINSDSNLGNWPAGYKLLQELMQ